MDTSGFFYIDGIPTKGAWVDLETVNDWDDIKAEIAKSLAIDADGIDEVLCADVEGIARHFYSSNCDGFSLTDWVEFRSEIEACPLNVEVIEAYLENCGVSDISTIEDAYQGEYDSWSDFAYEMAENCFSIPDEISQYFDYEKFGQDLSFDYFESNGYFFRNL